MHLKLLVYALCTASAGLSLSSSGQEVPGAGLDSLPEVNFSALSQPDRNPLGAQALAIRPQECNAFVVQAFRLPASSALNSLFCFPGFRLQ